jgi:hypothetical protein
MSEILRTYRFVSWSPLSTSMRLARCNYHRVGCVSAEEMVSSWRPIMGKQQKKGSRHFVDSMF